MRAAAWEILADVAIYNGHLLDVACITEELRSLGEALNDPHAIAIAGVDAALALAFDNQAGDALAALSGLDRERLSPSDQSWVMYARGEALSASGNPAAASAYAAAVEMALTIGNPFVSSVARVSLATEHARAGNFGEALDEYAICLHEYARHGNFVHAVTTLRSLVDVLVAVGDDHGATVLATATSGDHVRPSYGAENARLSTSLAAVSQRAGAARIAKWTEEGKQLDLPQAVKAAAELVHHHRS